MQIRNEKLNTGNENETEDFSGFPRCSSGFERDGFLGSLVFEDGGMAVSERIWISYMD